MKKNKGFSLIELLIVVAIILIIAAIAIPNLVKARLAANEGSATASMRTLGSAQMLYRSSEGAFSTDIAGLGGTAAGFIDNVLASGTKSGYLFATAAVSASPTLQFTSTAAPQQSSGVTATGKRQYFADESQVIRYALSAAATSASAPIE
jgi:type IV pilus assembly protein PilA